MRGIGKGEGYAKGAAKMMDYDELVESWINGNRKIVVAELRKTNRADLVAFCEELVRREGVEELGILHRLMAAAEGK